MSFPVLEVKELSCRGSSRDNHQQLILHDISFFVPSGALVALLAPSGAGKSTLLSILGNRSAPKVCWFGQILINKATADSYSSSIGFVHQEDILASTLTVEESVRFAALFRLSARNKKGLLPTSEFDELVSERVSLILQSLELTGIKDSRVGSALERGISGGQRRRLSLAIEMVMLPKILFLDEITTGL